VVIYFVLSVFPLYCLVVSASAIYCPERLVSEMTNCVLSGTLNLKHSHSLILTDMLAAVAVAAIKDDRKLISWH